jgi:hypothetical protein
LRKATAEANTFGAIAESWIRDPEVNRVDVFGAWLVDLRLTGYRSVKGRDFDNNVIDRVALVGFINELYSERC